MDRVRLLEPEALASLALEAVATLELEAAALLVLDAEVPPEAASVSADGPAASPLAPLANAAAAATLVSPIPPRNSRRLSAPLGAVTAGTEGTDSSTLHPTVAIQRQCNAIPITTIWSVPMDPTMLIVSHRPGSLRVKPSHVEVIRPVPIIPRIPTMIPESISRYRRDVFEVRPKNRRTTAPTQALGGQVVDGESAAQDAYPLVVFDTGHVREERGNEAGKECRVNRPARLGSCLHCGLLTMTAAIRSQHRDRFPDILPGRQPGTCQGLSVALAM
jgi:hypothetical protein